MPAGGRDRSRVPPPERCFARCTARFTGGENRRHLPRGGMEQLTPRRLRGLETVTVLGIEVPLASSPRARLLGLTLLDLERAGAGLLIPSCRSIHTFGMRFALDIRFIDSDGREVRAAIAVPPGQVLFERRATCVLELPSQAVGGFAGPPEGGESRVPAT